MDKHTVAGHIGDNWDAIVTGIRNFPTEKFYLLTPEERKQEAMKAKEEMEDDLGIETTIVELRGDLWESTFRAVSALKRDNSNLVMNVAATEDNILQCVATSAAFVNGLKAFGVQDGEPKPLPVMKFSYYRMLTEKKRELLEALNTPDCCASLQELGDKTEMTLPLISYHVNGNSDSPGLIDLGLAETTNEGRRTTIHLTPLGRMLVRGHVDTAEVEA